jgi:hypothetical protein
MNRGKTPGLTLRVAPNVEIAWLPFLEISRIQSSYFKPLFDREISPSEKFLRGRSKIERLGLIFGRAIGSAG